MSRAERLERGLAVSKRLFEQVDKNDWGYMEVSWARRGQWSLLLTTRPVP
jgi:hypothetical protein